MSRCHVDRQSTRGNANEESCRNLVSQSICTLYRSAKNKVGNNPVCPSVFSLHLPTKEKSLCGGQVN